MAYIPTKAEQASLKFLLFPSLPYVMRFVIAFPLYALGAILCLHANQLVWGLIPILAGHLVLWVRRQTLAPGGATPAHEQVWTPVEDEWHDQVLKLEKAGAAWDVTPLDISNGIGCLTLFAVGLTLAVLAFVVPLWGRHGAVPFMITVCALFVPVWFNGMRSAWSPSELRRKGDALRIARAFAERVGMDRFEAIPLLALREGKKGHYPVDARLMLRPQKSDNQDFIGIQVQVCLNNVRGVDYPYLYCVVLTKEDGELPRVAREKANLVYEEGKDEGVKFLVVRQFADRQGGWHTDRKAIEKIVGEAVNLARSCL